MRIRLAVWQDAPGFCERTGLRRADPPAGASTRWLAARWRPAEG